MGSTGSKAADVKSILKMKDVILLDVRSAGEVAAQPLQTAREVLNIPVGEVASKAQGAIPDQDGMILSPCYLCYLLSIITNHSSHPLLNELFIIFLMIAQVVVFCRSGMRSSSAIGVLKGMGYSNVRSLQHYSFIQIMYPNHGEY